MRFYPRTKFSYWDSLDNQKNYLDGLAEKLKLKRLSQWMKLDSKTLITNGGKGLLDQCHGDIPEVLSTHYPSLRWELMNHNPEKKSFFETKERQRSFLNDCARSMNVRTKKDLEALKREKIIEFGGRTLVNKYSSKSVNILSENYPEFCWDRMVLVPEEAPPGEPKESAYSFQPVPSRTFSLFWSSNEKQRRLMEEASKVFCLNSYNDFLKLDINSMEMFFKESLASVLLSKYENLLLLMRSIYPEYPWVKKNSKQKKVAEGDEEEEEKKPKTIGELKIPEHLWRKPEKSKPRVPLSEYPTPIHHLLTGKEGEPVPGASPIVNSSNQTREIKTGISLAHVWDNTIDPTGYWISEKYDGFRGVWNGKMLISRHGKEFKPPAFWLEYLPKSEWILDGELFVGYNQNHSVTSIIQSSNESSELSWKNMKFMIFDFLPSKSDAHLLFEERYELLKRHVVENEVIKIVPHYLCKGESHLLSELDRVVELGGEGLIIRKPHTCYTAGRSEAVLKVRKHLDCEVKYMGRSTTGVSFVCLLPNNLVRKVKCGMSDYNHPPEVGSILTVNHFGFLPNGGIKFPDFRRMRFDMTWEDVVERYKDVLVTPSPSAFKKIMLDEEYA